MSTQQEPPPLSLGKSVHGGRPTFVLTRRREDNEVYLTLYELLPEDQAKARQARFERLNKPMPIFELRDALERSTEAAPEEYSWDGWVAVKVARLSGGRLKTILGLVDEALREADNDPSTVTSTEEGEVFLPEAVGIRVALGFIGVKPLQRVDRMRAIAHGVAQMSTEECYYWHAKCRSPMSPNGSKALRELVSGHIN